MDPEARWLALRTGGTSHALEPGRDYRLGNDPAADIWLPAADRCISVSVLADGRVAWAESATSTMQPLAAGDVLHLGEAMVVVVPDDGTAAFVPVPALRRAARERRVRAAAKAVLRQRDDRSFQQMVADELRHAPWLATSLLLHLLLLLLAWLWYAERPQPRRNVAEVRVVNSPEPVRSTATVDVPDVVVEAEPPPPLAPMTIEPPPEREVELLPGATQPPSNARIAPRRRDRTVAGGDAAGVGGTGSGTFRQVVADLQESGLDIVFVFDSTGSMTRTIHDTKTTIVQMQAVLRRLVPSARIGLVTFRDRGRREEYLVREVPLDTDPWRATTFVQFVTAEGGGDRPEAVREGLAAAFALNWRAGARRVVVLAGDAPPHPEDEEAMLREVREFASDGRSFVHTLVTSPDAAGEQTREAFDRIALRGQGACVPIAGHERVLQRVLTLAFGRQFDADMQQVIASAEADRTRVDTASLDLVRRGGPELVKALRQRPMDETLWNALVRMPRRSTVELLLDQLASVGTPEHTRYALAAALQRIFDLAVPPMDPWTGRIDAAAVRQLRRRAAELP